MSQLSVLCAESASLVASAFEAALEGCTASWNVEALSHLTRAQARQHVIDETRDAIFLDERFSDLVRSAVKVQGATAQVAGGADLIFAPRGSAVAVNLFGSGAVTYLEKRAYSFGGSHVAVCGSGPRALSLVQALAVAGAERIVLVDETPRKSEEAMRLYLARYKRLAFATVDLAPTEDSHRSFREAFEEPTYQFGGFTTSTQAMAAADYVFAVGEQPFFTEVGVPESVFGNQILVSHVGVAPAESMFAACARDAGCTVADGRGATAFSIAQAAAVLAQLHYDYAAEDPEEVPELDEDALLHKPLERMFEDAARVLGVA